MPLARMLWFIEGIGCESLTARFEINHVSCQVVDFNVQCFKFKNFQQTVFPNGHRINSYFIHRSHGFQMDTESTQLLLHTEVTWFPNGHRINTVVTSHRGHMVSKWTQNQHSRFFIQWSVGCPKTVLKCVYDLHDNWQCFSFDKGMMKLKDFFSWDEKLNQISYLADV
jgi:hypothetical protein